MTFKRLIIWLAYLTLILPIIIAITNGYSGLLGAVVFAIPSVLILSFAGVTGSGPQRLPRTVSVIYIVVALVSIPILLSLTIAITGFSGALVLYSIFEGTSGKFLRTDYLEYMAIANIYFAVPFAAASSIIGLWFNKPSDLWRGIKHLPTSIKTLWQKPVVRKTFAWIKREIIDS